MRQGENPVAGRSASRFHLVAERLWPLAQNAWPFLLLPAALWVVRFWHSAEFGLYEDDLTDIPRAAAMSWGDAVAFAVDPDRILHLYGQGHPLFYTFIYFLVSLGWRIRPLVGAYWLGFAVEALNVGLFCGLLKRVHSQSLAVVGGLMYVLYSADTTQAFLTHALGLHPSLTCLLLAAHAYLSGRKWLTYPLAGLTLLTYETVFPVTLAFPLLVELPARKWRRALLSHVAICAVILIAVVVWRVAVGEDRVGELTLLQALTTPLLHMVQGPVVSLGTYLYRPLQALQAMDLEIGVVALLYTILFSCLGLWLGRAVAAWDAEALRRSSGSQGEPLPLWTRARRAWTALPGEIRPLLRLASAGLVMLVLAYPLTFTVRGYAISGRETRVHSAGVMGAALLVGSAILELLYLLRQTRWRRLLAGGLAAWIGLLAGFGLVVQNDYVMAWKYQRQFWRQLIPLVEDAGNGTAILVDPAGLVDTRQIGANTWNLPRVLEQLYCFPNTWEQPPRVFRLLPGWEHRIASESGLFQLNGATVTAPESVLDRYPSTSVILIDTATGILSRRTGSLRIPGGDFPLKLEGEPVLPFLPKGLLYSLMVLDPQTDTEGAQP